MSLVANTAVASHWTVPTSDPPGRVPPSVSALIFSFHAASRCSISSPSKFVESSSYHQKFLIGLLVLWPSPQLKPPASWDLS